MKTKTRQSLSLFLLSLPLFFLLFVWLWRAFFFLFFFWASLPLHSQKSRVCSSLCWTMKRRKKKERVFPPSKLSLFLCFAAALFFFVRRDQTTRDGFDERTEEKYRKKREREKPKKDKGQNVKTRKRALREEKASPFSVEKERATFYPFDFFSSRGDT